MSEEINSGKKIKGNQSEIIKETKPDINVESIQEIKPEIKEELKETINSDIIDNINIENKIIDNKILSSQKKKLGFFGSIKETMFPSQPNIIRKNISPKFVYGLLIGFYLSYYLHYYKISSFLNNREAFLKEEIEKLRKEIDHIKGKDKILGKDNI